MNYKSIFVFSALIVMGVLPSILNAQTLQFDRLKQKFEEGYTFYADFEHELTDSYTGEVLTSTGEIWIGNDSYKLKSEGQTLVVDGETSKVFDESRNRVIIDKYIPEDDDFAPSRMLQGVDSTYIVTEKKLDSGTLVTLRSTDDFAVFTTVEIILDQNGIPTVITATDISENIIVTTFSKGVFQKANDDLFDLTYPEDAEVIDLRY